MDLVLTTDDALVNSIEYLSAFGASDHCGLYIELTCSPVIPPYLKTLYYYSSDNYNHIRQQLQLRDWPETFKNCHSNVIEQWNILEGIIKDLMDEKIPKGTIDSNQRQKWDMPCDIETRKFIHKKHRLWTRYRETGDVHTHREFCKLRKKVRTTTRKLRKKYEKYLASKAKENPKYSWKYIKNRTKTRKDIADLHKEFSTLISD